MVEERENIFKKRKYGITLVSLVITIVILMILAGVTISFVFMGEGIVNRAENSAIKMNTTQEKEQNILQELEKEMLKAAKETIKTSGTDKIKLEESSAGELKDYKIYGESLQNGVPTPETPALISNLGESGNIKMVNYGKNLYKTAEDYNYNDYGLLVQAEENKSTFYIHGTPTQTGNILATFGPVVEQGKYRIKIEGKNLDYYYIQTKSDSHDWLNIKLSNSIQCLLNEVYNFELTEKCQIRIGLGVTNLNTVYNHEEYKVLLQEASRRR